MWSFLSKRDKILWSSGGLKKAGVIYCSVMMGALWFKCCSTQSLKSNLRWFSEILSVFRVAGMLKIYTDSKEDCFLFLFLFFLVILQTESREGAELQLFGQCYPCFPMYVDFFFLTPYS